MTTILAFNVITHPARKTNRRYTNNELPAHQSKVIASKISKCARGFKIPADKKPKIKSKSKVHKKK